METKSSENAGCDRCGINDRADGSKFCVDCLKPSNLLPKCPNCRGETELDGNGGFDCHFCGNNFKA